MSRLRLAHLVWLHQATRGANLDVKSEGVLHRGGLPATITPTRLDSLAHRFTAFRESIDEGREGLGARLG